MLCCLPVQHSMHVTVVLAMSSFGESDAAGTRLAVPVCHVGGALFMPGCSIHVLHGHTA